jgi:CheY-like chemotaxis protein
VAPEQRPTGRKPLRGLRLVVLDDDEGVRSTFSRLAERAGAQTEEMDPTLWDSLEAGMKALVAFAPSAILLDLTLGPYSAPDLTRLLKEQAPRLYERVIFFTGGTDPGPMDRPVASKLLPWEEIVDRIRSVALAAGERDRRG